MVILVALAQQSALAINITVDYRYDTTDPKFFNTQQKIDALEAAAARYSAIITTSLTAEALANNSTDPRIGFTHPTTGASFDVSPASNVGSDVLGTPSATCMGCYPANEYRGPWSIAQDQWILYAGGRSLAAGTAGEGGTGTGLNFGGVFTDEGSHLNRAFRSVSVNDNLPVWGGSVSFDNDGSTNWHFDSNTPAPASKVDFYTIALHEIGHALGLSADHWIDWNRWTPGTQFTGPDARAAYNADNGTSLTGLNLVSASDEHWKDATYDSRIFNNGNPNYVGTVGPGALQDLLMEPTANFTGSVRRFELTNVDVAALEDVGWSVIPQIDVLAGDYNNDGIVDAADYVKWRKVQATGSYATWRTNFGESNSGSGGDAGLQAAVPEPATLILLTATCVAVLLMNLSRRVRSRLC